MNTVIFFGSRGWTDYSTIFWRMALLPKGTVIRHGAARGADSLASRAAKALGLKEDPFPMSDEEWRTIGYGAGHRRNERMANKGAELAIGFRAEGKSNGTDGMSDYCEKVGIPVEKHGTGWKYMSSTSKGELSTENWETPYWCVRRLLEEIWLPPGEWIEPMAGNGRIIGAVNEDRPGAIRWTACELRAECAPKLKKYKGIHNLQCPIDFYKGFSAFKNRGKKEDPTDPTAGFFDVAISTPFDVAITNPPFSQSMQILSKLLAISDYVVMLQRLNWLGSGVNNGKNEFLRGCMPDVYVLPDRVKFLINGKFPRYPEGTRGGKNGEKDLSGQLMPGDSIEYAWYVWKPGKARFQENGIVRNLLPTKPEERGELEEAIAA